MSPAEKKLAALLLDRAADQFSRHGCNDLDLVREAGLTPEQSYEVRQQMRARSGDELAPEEHPDRHMTDDWRVMRWLAHRLRS